MFEKEIDFLKTLQNQFVNDTNNNLYEDLDNIIFDLENFNVIDYLQCLKDSDIIEIILTLLERLENNEREKAKKAIKNDNGFYNSELKKSENNIDIFKKIYDLLCYKTY